MVFSISFSKGKMTHSLSEPILEAPELGIGKDIKIALNHLEKSLVAFKQYAGKLLAYLNMENYQKRNIR